jgi:hypothetical protein
MLDVLAAFKLWRPDDHPQTDFMSRRIVPGVFVVVGVLCAIVGIARLA